MSETIAFIGCGAMGAPIAERLIDAGYAVRLFDPREAALAPLEQRGGVAAKSPRDAATGAAVAFACLPSPEISRAVAFGTEGVINAPSLRTMSRCPRSARPPCRRLRPSLQRRISS